MSSIDSLNVWKFVERLKPSGGRALLDEGDYWKWALRLYCSTSVCSHSLLPDCEPSVTSHFLPPYLPRHDGFASHIVSQGKFFLLQVACARHSVTAMETVAKAVRLSHGPAEATVSQSLLLERPSRTFRLFVLFLFLISHFKEMTWSPASGSFHLQNSLGAALKQINFRLPPLAELLYHQPASDYRWLPVCTHLASYSDGEDGFGLHVKSLLN